MSNQNPGILLIGAIVAAVVGNLLLAIFLRATARYFLRETISYKDAYLSLLLGSLANIVFAFIIGFAAASAGFMTERDSWKVYVFIWVVSYAVLCACVSNRTKLSFMDAGQTVFAAMFLMAVVVIGGTIAFGFVMAKLMS